MKHSGYFQRLSLLLAVAAVVSACNLEGRTKDPLTTSGDGVSSGASGGSSGSGGSGTSGTVGLAPLSLSTLSPNKVSFKSGGLVTLTGTGFNARTRILINGQICPDAGIISSTTATCFVGKTPNTGPVKVRVFNYTEPASFYEQDLMYVTDGFSMATIVASSVVGGDSEGLGTAAAFGTLTGGAIVGNFLYVGDYADSTIWKIDLDTAGATPFNAVRLVGSSSNIGRVDGDFDPMSATPASVYYPSSLIAVGTKLYFTEYNGGCIRQADLVAQTVTTVAGVCNSTGAVNATGSAARFNVPEGLASDGTSLYVGDTSNNMIRKVSLADFSVTTLAGQRTGGRTDLPGTSAKFYGPASLVYRAGKLYVADKYNSMIRVVDVATAAVSTLTGGRNEVRDGPPALAGFVGMSAMVTDGTDLFVADSSNDIVRRVVIATGEVRLLAGGGTGNFDDIIYDAQLDGPNSITYSPTLGLLVGGAALWQVQ